MLRRLGWILFAFIALVALLLAGLYLFSGARMVRAYEVEPQPIAVPASSEAVERGRYLAEAVTKCVDCHGEDLGGEVFIDDPMMGRLSADNLTAGEGGLGRRYTRDDWLRALRHGVGPDDRSLLFMPSQEYAELSDADMGALLAYLQSLPAIDRELPANRVGPLARLLLLAGQLPLLPAELIDQDRVRYEAPPRAETAAYGEYLAATGGCTGCHGANLAGGPIPGAPPDAPEAANLTPDEDDGIGDWSEADFFTAMREGTRPDGTELDPFMPWQAVGRMTDGDLRALWLHLEQLEPRETGDR